MEKGAAGYPQGHTNPGISRDLASRLPYFKSGSEGGSGNGGSANRTDCPPYQYHPSQFHRPSLPAVGSLQNHSLPGVYGSEKAHQAGRADGTPRR
jgi:hypothetical protein